MKYSRGRLIALVILSVTVVLALFGAGLLYNFRDAFNRNVTAETTNLDPEHIPTFDELYQRVPYSPSDTGRFDIGNGTMLTLIEDSYNRGTLLSFLRSNQKLGATGNNKRASFSTFQRGELRRDGYPYPIYTNDEMRLIANGMGEGLEIPVALLDPSHYDDIVLLELTNITEAPKNLKIVHNGNEAEYDIQQGSVKLFAVDDNYDEDQVYCGVPKYSPTTMIQPIYDTDGTTVLFQVVMRLDSEVNNGYYVSISDADLYTRDITNQLVQIEAIEEGTTILCDSNGTELYTVTRSSNTVTVSNQGGVQLGQVIYHDNEHQVTTYEIGAVAYNGKALRGMFRDQGLYEISFEQLIKNANGTKTPVKIAFAFIIANRNNYVSETDTGFPRFNTENRMIGLSEIYNYSYESEYPTVTYPKNYFDVEIDSEVVDYYKTKFGEDQQVRRFYNIGKYQMVSKLQYYNDYLYQERERLSNRGVNTGIEVIEDGITKIIKAGCIELKRYQAYRSTLNIVGFQAYYGWQDDGENSGPIPFYDRNNAEVSSDISAWVRAENRTAADMVTNYESMNVGNALSYSNDLANAIAQNRTASPVRTNFPPVKIEGNINHATGSGINGGEAVLSTVAFRPAYGANNTRTWESRTLDVGAPLEEPGEYVVVVYFKVNDKLCQQTFYFEIINSAHIRFDVTKGSETKTLYAGELELNQDFCINATQIKLNYDISPFEIEPTISLSFAEFGNYNYRSESLVKENDGSFNLKLNKIGHYLLTLNFGAHHKATTVYDITVDDTKAEGFTVITQARVLANSSNIAVVGAGETSLSWHHKSSGINYKSVTYEFYEMRKDAVIDPNISINYTNFTNVENLFSAYAFSSVPSRPDNGYMPVKTENGWKLNETFHIAGLYRFTITDDVDNETQYVLIIDNSTPIFIQSGDKSTMVTNAVNFTEGVGVKVGFGKNKLIRGTASIFDDITVPSSLLNNNLNAICIGLASVQYSESGDEYKDVSVADLNNGYVTLNREGTFYFRVTDVLGNVGEYYIVLTHDNCFGMIYAEEEYSAVPISTDVGRSGRGMVTAEPNRNTSLVDSRGGMTNRHYITFAFQQRKASEGGAFRVTEVYLQYYPLTYDKTSSNYPFAENPINNPYENGKRVFAAQDNTGKIYEYNGTNKQGYDNNGGMIRLALFNVDKETPSGMYIITRRYDSCPDQNDTSTREYYFIVDDQGMLYFDPVNPDKYQTKLKVRFAETENSSYYKEAKYNDFNQNDNELSSNRTAWVYGFENKYECWHDTIVYMGRSFPSLRPRFTFVNNHQTVILGEGSGHPWAVGDPASRSDDKVYKLYIMDNARNISCMLVDGNIYEFKNDDAPTSANWGCLTLNLEIGHGTKAEIITSNNQTINSSAMEYLGESTVAGNSGVVYKNYNYLYVLDADINQIDQLKFQFAYKPTSMYADVDIEKTFTSWLWTSNGVTRAVTLKDPSLIDDHYVFDLKYDFFSHNGIGILNGDSLSVRLYTREDDVTYSYTNYKILFDADSPNYNVDRVKAGDNLARTLTEDEWQAMADAGKNYIYGLSTDFVFEADPGNMTYLDTRNIWYSEADPSGKPVKPRVSFKLYNENSGESRIAFADLVGLRENEMKYYLITEYDYAGHKTEYCIQIQGANYINAVSFIGATSKDGAEIQMGTDMRVSNSSMDQFFAANNSFKFESGDEYYTVLGGLSRWHIGNDTGSSNSTDKERLIQALNNWINNATMNGTKCAYTLYDRMGDVEFFEFYNIKENAVRMQLDCYKPSENSNYIVMEIINYADLPVIMFESKLDPLYKLEIEEVKEVSEVIDGKEVINRKVYPFNYIGNFSLNTKYINIPYNGKNDLVIKVTDPFGRTSITEYHQQLQGSIYFKTYGNTTTTEDGIIIVGHEDGVEFDYHYSVYQVKVYNADTDEELGDNVLQPFIVNGRYEYIFKPKMVGTNAIKVYRIEARGRASGAILFEKTFAIDTRMPEITWKNASKQTIEVNNQRFVSAITLTVDNIDVNAIYPMSPVIISYTREINGEVESLTLRRSVSEVTFVKEGSYKVVIRNGIWAERIFTFEIVKINDSLVIVYDDEKEIYANKNTTYKYNNEDIPQYIFTTEIDEETKDEYEIIEYVKHGLKVEPGQMNRVLEGRNGNEYWDYDNQNTLIWRFATNGMNPIYIATTGVSREDLPNNNSITLKLNGNPVVNEDPSSSVNVSLNSTYNIIYKDFMDSHDNQVTVQLECNSSSIGRDINGVPYHRVEGNAIVVDCYYNGLYVVTLNYGETFTINKDGAGYYDFYVHDMAGNYLYFGDSGITDENHINYPTNHYTLVVITKPMITINDKQPVNGMIYNDRVELKTVEYGKDFLNKFYQFKFSEGDVTASRTDFFNQYFRITKVLVNYGSNEIEEFIPKSGSPIVWNQSGSYVITVF